LTGAGWDSGQLEFESGTDALSVGVLAWFGEGTWFPVERSLDVDAVQGAFIVPEDPEALAVGAAGQFLGPATIECPDLPRGGYALATVTAFGSSATLPLLLAGEGADIDDETGGGTDGIDVGGDVEGGEDEDEGEGEDGGSGDAGDSEGQDLGA